MAVLELRPLTSPLLVNLNRFTMRRYLIKQNNLDGDPDTDLLHII